MFQQKKYTVTFTPSQSAAERIAAVQQALIDQGIPSGHQLYLQAPAFEDLHIGAWPELYCGDEDFKLAQTALIAW